MITIDLDGNWALSLIFSCTLYRMIQVAGWMSKGAKKASEAAGSASKGSCGVVSRAKNIAYLRLK